MGSDSLEPGLTHRQVRGLRASRRPDRFPHQSFQEALVLEYPLDFQVGGTIEVNAGMRYLAEEPYAVHLVFPGWATADGEEAVWTFGRDLLLDGLHGAAGDGDVRVIPMREEGRTAILLVGPEGSARLEVQSQQLRDFLAATEACVARGREAAEIDWDGGIAQLLGDLA